MRVHGRGGAGGGGTVQTDGVTIQGDGSAGNKIAIKAVQTAARLIGAGTVASPLDVAGWPLTSYASLFALGGVAANTNQTRISGFALPAPLRFSQIGVRVGATDAVNNYDLGVYNAAGTLIANIGAQPLPTTGFVSFATVQGAQTILPGIYAFAFTGNAGTAQIFYDSGDGLVIFSNQNYQVTVGGALAASVPAVTPAPNTNGLAFILF